MSSRPADTPRQLPLDLVHPVARSRDDLVVAAANAEAAALLERWPDWPSPVVVLAGPAGSGKSHLAAIWRADSGAARFDGGTLDAPVMERAGRGPVLIDDIDMRPIDEVGLFHLINAVREAGTSLLLTARRFPTAWGVRLPDLASRLRAASIVEIREPDDVLLAAVLTKLFADRQIDVEPHVVQYLVRRMERSLSSAMEVVARLDSAALEQKTRITRPLAAHVLAAMDAGQQRLDL